MLDFNLASKVAGKSDKEFTNCAPVRNIRFFYQLMCINVVLIEALKTLS